MMTKELAASKLAGTLNDIIDEIVREVSDKKTDIEQELLETRDIEKILSLADKISSINAALTDIGRCGDVALSVIQHTDSWYDCNLLSELDRVFRLLPKEDEAE